MRKSNLLGVSHASLLKRLTKTMECTTKHVTEVTATEKWEYMTILWAVRKKPTSVSVRRRVAASARSDDVRQVRVDDVIAPDTGERSCQLIGRRRVVAMATLSWRHPAGEHDQGLFGDVAEWTSYVRNVALGDSQGASQPSPVTVYSGRYVC